MWQTVTLCRTSYCQPPFPIIEGDQLNSLMRTINFTLAYTKFMKVDKC